MTHEKLTTQELMFLEEHLRSDASVTKFMDYASQMITDPEIKSLCDRLSKEHKDEITQFSGFIGGRTTLQQD
jgi:hypothetical protein